MAKPTTKNFLTGKRKSAEHSRQRARISQVAFNNQFNALVEAEQGQKNRAAYLERKNLKAPTNPAEQETMRLEAKLTNATNTSDAIIAELTRMTKGLQVLSNNTEIPRKVVKRISKLIQDDFYKLEPLARKALKEEIETLHALAEDAKKQAREARIMGNNEGQETAIQNQAAYLEGATQIQNEMVGINILGEAVNQFANQFASPAEKLQNAAKATTARKQPHPTRAEQAHTVQSDRLNA